MRLQTGRFQYLLNNYQLYLMHGCVDFLAHKDFVNISTKWVKNKNEHDNKETFSDLVFKFQDKKSLNKLVHI